MSYIKMIRVVLFFGLTVTSVKGIDPFERSVFKLHCVKVREMKNCPDKLIALYKNLSRSYNNGSAAETAFYLYTRRNSDHPEDLQQCGGQLPSNTFFNSSDEVKIVVHGYNDGLCETAWMREMKDQFLIRGPYNVILVDWTWGNIFDYGGILNNVPIVASQTAIVIRNIMRQTAIDGKKFHIIGHSVGAHAAGFVGKELKIGRITGLSPAGPGYDKAPKNERLDSGDADVVDCIHTNGGLCLPKLGLQIPICGANFYVNGGRVQYNCILQIPVSIFKGDILYALSLLLFDVCSHTQAIQYFKASINPDGQFVGAMCDNYEDFRSGKCNSCGIEGTRCAVMGLDYAKYLPKPDKSNYIKYYLDTLLTCPYVDNKKINLQGFKTLLET